VKLPSPRDIPRGAASVAVALALIAGVVAGRDEPGANGSPANRASEQPRATAANAAQPGLPDLDIEKLSRAAKSGEVTDLFALKTAMLAPAPPATSAVASPPPPPPAKPTAPPLPFGYFGKWVDGEKNVVFLWRNNEGYGVVAGDTVDGTYRVDSITESSIDFTYLPLGSKQTLLITEPN